MAIEISGTNEVIKELLKKAEPQQLESAMNQCCLLVEKTAKEKAPSRTGELRNSIISEVQVNDNGIEGVVSTPLMYAPYVEYGTGLFAASGRKNVPWHYQSADGEWHTTNGMPPQPFLIPALNENREEILSILNGGISNG